MVYHTDLTPYRTDLSGRLPLTPPVVLLLLLQLTLDERLLHDLLGQHGHFLNKRGADEDMLRWGGAAQDVFLCITDPGP